MTQQTLSRADKKIQVVRYASLEEDTEAYPDVMDDARRREISHVLGQHPKAVLRNQHKFHVGFLTSGANAEPPLHAHDYSEIFMVLKGGYRFFWGNHAEHHVDLGPLDMFAVPPKVMRKFHSNREQPGTIMVIFDTILADPDDGIVISQALIDEEGGAEKYAKFHHGWGESIDEKGIQPYIARIADLSSKAPKGGGIVPLIAAGHPDAGISTPHEVTAQFLFVNGALEIEPTGFTEVFIPVKGSCSLAIDDLAEHLEPLDTLSAEGGGPRHISAEDDAQVVVLRIIDTRPD